MYIAVDRLLVGYDAESGAPIYREPGDPIPEAEEWLWTLRDSFLRNNRIARAAAPPAPAKKEAAHAK